MSLTDLSKHLVRDAKFDTGDFMEQENVALVDVDDVTRVVQFYVEDLSDEGLGQRKANVKSARKTTDLLSARGLKKLHDVRNSLACHARRIKSEQQLESKIEWTDFTDTSEDMRSIRDERDTEKLIELLHALGTYPCDSPEYYLYVVNRFYVSKYQSTHRAKFVSSPTWVSVLDSVNRYDHVVKFSADFRAHLEDAKGRRIASRCVNVPSKSGGHGKVHVEALDWVQELRSKIFFVFAFSTERLVPKYLLKESECADEVRKIGARYERMKTLKRQLSVVCAIGYDDLQKAIEEEPRLGRIADEYDSHRFSSPDEQLEERVAFLCKNTCRQPFAALNKGQLLDKIFDNSGIGYSNHRLMEDFCHTRRSLNHIHSDKAVARCLLVSVYAICNLFRGHTQRYEYIDPLKYLCEHMKPML